MKKGESKIDLGLKYIFIFLVASAIGRFYEFFLILGEGSLNYVNFFPTCVYTLIFALPYGFSVILIYFTFRVLDKSCFTDKLWIKIFVGAVLIDFAELITGLIGMRITGIMPWDYSHHILNYKGLISFPITIRWIILVAIVGKFGYNKIVNFMDKPLPKKIKMITISVLILWGVYLIFYFGLKRFGML
ncbi:MAG: putative ABC transporter permease [Candidatus Pacearchaeota archaeon]|nr:putative ABC transporter permease [Candidatus Pacearchaeota archaeon]